MMVMVMRKGNRAWDHSFNRCFIAMLFDRPASSIRFKPSLRVRAQKVSQVLIKSIPPTAVILRPWPPWHKLLLLNYVLIGFKWGTSSVRVLFILQHHSSCRRFVVWEGRRGRRVERRFEERWLFYLIFFKDLELLEGGASSGGKSV
jgi:hypothetical protein